MNSYLVLHHLKLLNTRIPTEGIIMPFQNYSYKSCEKLPKFYTNLYVAHLLSFVLSNSLNPLTFCMIAKINVYMHIPVLFKYVLAK